MRSGLLQPYCCSEAVKNALKLKEADPGKDVTIIYRMSDLWSQGGLLQEGERTERQVRPLRRRPETGGSQDGNQIAVTIFDPILNEKVELKTDLLALSVGLSPIRATRTSARC